MAHAKSLLDLWKSSENLWKCKWIYWRETSFANYQCTVLYDHPQAKVLPPYWGQQMSVLCIGCWSKETRWSVTDWAVSHCVWLINNDITASDQTRSLSSHPLALRGTCHLEISEFIPLLGRKPSVINNVKQTYWHKTLKRPQSSTAVSTLKRLGHERSNESPVIPTADMWNLHYRTSGLLCGDFIEHNKLM